MADLQNFSVSAGGTVSVNVNQFTVSCQVVDSATGALIADFTGGNSLVWPNVLATLTAVQRRFLLGKITNDIIFMKAGIG